MGDLIAMAKIERRAVIIFLVKKEKALTEIIDYFTNGYGDSLPSHSTIRKWAAQPGQQSLDDDPWEKVVHPWPSSTRTFALWICGSWLIAE